MILSFVFFELKLLELRDLFYWLEFLLFLSWHSAFLCPFYFLKISLSKSLLSEFLLNFCLIFYFSLRIF